MIKVVAMVKRKEGLTLEEFKQYWYEKHAPLALKVTPGEAAPAKYVHNYAVAMEGAGETAFDGIGSLYYEDREALFRSNEWFFGEGGEVLREDELNFVDTSTRVAMLVEEKEIVPATGELEGTLKLMAMLKRKNGMTPEEFKQYWYEVHAPLALKAMSETIRVKKYVQNHALRLSEDQESPFDGIVEFYLEDLKAFEAWMTFYVSDEGEVIRDDEDKFIDKSAMLVVIAEERVIPQ